jgi:NAD(P)-dependent dehydrogenase (short-subunit alcohol dehydrogenase family)
MAFAAVYSNLSLFSVWRMDRQMTTMDSKTAVVTGAAEGIGAAIARRFVESGFRVIAGDADADALNALAAEWNSRERSVWKARRSASKILS